MKKLLTIATILILNVCQAQEYSLNNPPISFSDAPAGAYFKDIEGVLNPYVGLWKGTWNGKTLYIEFRKVKYQLGDIYRDAILGERKIINVNGLIEIDRISTFDNVDSEFFGVNISLARPFYKSLHFYPKNMCGKTATIDIKFIDAAKTQMQMYFRYDPSSYDPNCIHNAYVNQYGEFPVNFPKDIILTKQ